MNRHTTALVLPVTLAAFALTGCSGGDSPKETASPSASTTSASASATSATPTTAKSATPNKTPTSAPTTAPVETAPAGTPEAQPAEGAAGALDTASGVAWYTDKEDPALLAQYGLVADVYYPRVDDRNTMCAQSQPSVCTTPTERMQFMDASIDQFQDDYEAQHPEVGGESSYDPDATPDVAGPPSP